MMSMILSKTKNCSSLLKQIFHKIPIILKKSILCFDYSFLSINKNKEEIFKERKIYELILTDLESIKEISKLR